MSIIKEIAEFPGFKIFHRSFTVERDADMPGLDGHIDYSRDRIRLSRGMSQARLIETLLHELIHGMDNAGRIKDDGKDLSESEIWRFVNSLLSTVPIGEVQNEK